MGGDPGHEGHQQDDDHDGRRDALDHLASVLSGFPSCCLTLGGRVRDQPAPSLLRDHEGSLGPG
jgi:hypothetical protein